MLTALRAHLATLYTAWEADEHCGAVSGSDEGEVRLIYTLDSWLGCYSDQHKYSDAASYLSGVEIISRLCDSYGVYQFDSIEEAYEEVMSWVYNEDQCNCV